MFVLSFGDTLLRFNLKINESTMWVPKTTKVNLWDINTRILKTTPFYVSWTSENASLVKIKNIFLQFFKSKTDYEINYN